MSSVHFHAERLTYPKRIEKDEARREREEKICNLLNSGRQFKLTVWLPKGDLTIMEVRGAVLRLAQGSSKNVIRFARIIYTMEPKFQPGFKDQEWYLGHTDTKDLNDTITLEQFEEALKREFGTQFTGLTLLNTMK